MAAKKENKMVQITLPPYHQKKLATMCSTAGLSKSQVIQRLIETFNLFGKTKEKRAE